MSDRISAQGVTVTQTSLSDGRALVNDKTVDAFFYIEDNQMNLLFESNDAVKTGVVTKSIQTAIKELSSGSFMKTEFIYGKSDDSMFNSLGYIMLGIISFFIVFIIAGISFVRERTNQTMERLMMTPVKRWEVVCGYTLGFGFFAALQSIILIAFVKWVLKMPIAGSE
jgi:ABC-2 type transport system permease protein